MKKCAAIIFFCVLASGAAFTQEAKLFTVRAEVAADPLFVRSFFDDYAERTPSVNVGSPPFMYQGEGSIKSFQSSGFVNGMAGRVRFAYEDDIVGGILELRSLNELDYGWVNNTQYIRYGALGDWNLWARLFGEHLRILAGNTAQRGQISAYSSFDGFLKNNVGSLGVFYPLWRRSPRAKSLINNLNIRSTFPYTSGDADYNMGFADFSSTDTLDMFYTANMTGRQQLGFLVDGVFAPVTVSVSAGGLFSRLSYPFKTPWNEGDSTRLSDYDSINDPVEVTGMSFGLRVEGAQIAGMLTVAAVYKYSESSLSKLTAPENDTLNYLLDESNGSHSFGLYATVKPLAGLGITVGWSALTQYWKNPFYMEYDLTTDTNGADHAVHWLSRFKEVRFPFYNGIDLRFHYTGVEQFVFTFNNNISFASVQGADHTDDAYSLYVNGWAYIDSTGLNPSGTINRESWKESYLGLFNALGAEYAVTKTFSATVQAANRLGTFTLTRDDAAGPPVTSITNSLSLYAGVNYRIAGRRELVRFTIRTGMACNLNSYLYQFTARGTPIQRAGYIDYGIPLSLALTF